MSHLPPIPRVVKRAPQEVEENPGAGRPRQPEIRRAKFYRKLRNGVARNKCANDAHQLHLVNGTVTIPFNCQVRQAHEKLMLNVGELIFLIAAVIIAKKLLGRLVAELNCHSDATPLRLFDHIVEDDAHGKFNSYWPAILGWKILRPRLINSINDAAFATGQIDDFEVRPVTGTDI